MPTEWNQKMLCLSDGLWLQPNNYVYRRKNVDYPLKYVFCALPNGYRRLACVRMSQAVWSESCCSIKTAFFPFAVSRTPCTVSCVRPSSSARVILFLAPCRSSSHSQVPTTSAFTPVQLEDPGPPAFHSHQVICELASL